MIDTGSINETGENVIHFGGVRIRVNGTGNLLMTMYSLDNIRFKALAPLVMATTTYKEPVKLVNFVSQRAFLKIETTELNEIFRINRVVVFARPVASQYPGS